SLGHIGFHPPVLDSAVTAEEALAQAVMAVAKRGLPGDHQVVWEIECNRDRVRHLTAILFGEYSSRHICRGWQRQVECSHNPRDLVHHIFSHIAPREFPEQTPVDQAERVEWPGPSAVKKRTPIHIMFCAIR